MIEKERFFVLARKYKIPLAPFIKGVLQYCAEAYIVTYAAQAIPQIDTARAEKIHFHLGLFAFAFEKHPHRRLFESQRKPQLVDQVSFI